MLPVPSYSSSVRIRQVGLRDGLPGEPLYGMTPDAGLPKGFVQGFVQGSVHG